MPIQSSFHGRAARLLGIVVALGLGLASPARATGGEDGAEKLRRMDIMLMVTALRCRTTADNFIDDYGRFTTSHMSDLNIAYRELRDRYAERYGTAGAERQVDQLGVIMANSYGAGHPWLSCSELRQVTRSLALVEGRATLEEAADQLLDRQPRPLLALAGH